MKDITIRRAGSGDIAAIRRMWREIFGDSYKYIDFFLEKRYNSNVCFVGCDGDEPVAMLHALPCTFVSGGRRRSCMYLYAIGTLEAYRGGGIAGELVRRCTDEGQRNGIEVFCLLPASDGLYEYYSRLGFKPFFYRSVTEISPSDVEGAAREVFEPDASDVYRIRESFLSRGGDYVSWDMNTLRYGIDECLLTGGKVIGIRGDSRDKDMYAFVRMEDGAAVVKEFAGDDIGALCGAVKLAFPEAVTVRISAACGTVHGETVRYGMIYGNTGNGARPYLGIALD